MQDVCGITKVLNYDIGFWEYLGLASNADFEEILQWVRNDKMYCIAREHKMNENTTPTGRAIEEKMMRGFAYAKCLQEQDDNIYKNPCKWDLNEWQNWSLIQTKESYLSLFYLIVKRQSYTMLVKRKNKNDLKKSIIMWTMKIKTTIAHILLMTPKRIIIVDPTTRF